MSSTTSRTTKIAAAGIATLAVAALAGCGAGRTGDAAGGAGIVLGTTDKIFALDPAASYDNGSKQVQAQVFQTLLDFPAGGSAPMPDAAEKCEFTAPTVFTCTLRPGLQFANGNPLTANSVKFSFDRMLKINDPNGPASLLGNLAKTDAVDERTVNFTLKVANDQTFAAGALSANAGYIVDEKSFPADKAISDEEVVKANPFSGVYTIGSYDKNKLVEYKANPGYNGIQGKPKSDTVSVKYYASSDNLKLDVQNGAIDIAYRSLTPTDIDSLRGNDTLTVHEGPGGELRYIVFNLNTMPGNDPAQKLAVRKALASSIDRAALASGIYKDLYTPVYSSVPKVFPDATEAFKDAYGEKPNKDAAAKYLRDAGLTTPVQLNLQYNSDHYGTSSEEYAAIKNQLEGTGLFQVNLQSTEWVTYQKERAKDGYPVFQFGWFPDFPDADNYLTPFFAPNNMLQSHFEDPKVTALITAQLTEADPVKRKALLAQVQTELAQNHIPILPLLTGKQIAVAGKNVQGVGESLDLSSKLRYGMLSK
ncbi:ABC transporter substrate-binding protein [Nocardia crassostreae]|uniref:ABC transporter substrate-binding protein n=1 Tax=Nocardia crassostreae TaxID=53428 RepID=UPI000A00969F|nr:ABC transporter substrate-binding protein [Nocardia crassostreae]